MTRTSGRRYPTTKPLLGMVAKFTIRGISGNRLR